MMVLCSNHSSKAFHAFALKHPGKIGWLFRPSGYRTRTAYLPFALDNDAFSAWKNSSQWNEPAWMRMLNSIAAAGKTPMWILVPDKVADRDATLRLWEKYYPIVISFGWPLAFAVQDGMTERDVPQEAEIVFVGGTTKWKWRSLPTWTANFPRVHVGRVNTGYRLEIAERNGAESVDGTGFMRKTMAGVEARPLIHFVEGYRNPTPYLPFTTGLIIGG